MDTMQYECREGARLSKNDIIKLLAAQDGEMQSLFSEAVEVKERCAGKGIYLRGLIEYSNVCRKDCYYCGIRRSMNCGRYTLTPQQVLGAARYAMEQDWGSVVLQGGENMSAGHIGMIERLLREITAMSAGKLGITISFGEQSVETYRRWLDAGAHRYLLRIEASDRELYSRLHPDDSDHSYDTRVKALYDLRDTGYMVGTGVMVGLPGQTLANLTDDLLFMKELDIDMCGMGPYVESQGTPLAETGWPVAGSFDLTDPVQAAEAALREPGKRLEMTLKMTAVLRMLMPDINIAAATALEAIDPRGRERAVGAGANVVMLNITPGEMRPRYALYDNKPFTTAGLPFVADIVKGSQGNPLHFAHRSEKR